MKNILTKFRNIFSLIVSPFSDFWSFLLAKYKYNQVLSFAYGVTIGSNSEFEGCNTIGSKSHFKGYMGYGSYMSSNCSIEGRIGRFTSIGPEVVTPRGIHPFRSPYVSTSPMFFSTNRITGRTFAKKQTFEEWMPPVTIGNDVWMGQRVLIKGGVTIGDGAVIYASAVVTNDIPPYAIAAGVPAKIIGYRYSSDIIDKLLKIKWWNKSLEWIESHASFFNDIEEFIKYSSEV